MTANGRLRALFSSIPVVVVPLLPAGGLLSSGSTGNLLELLRTCM